MDPSRERDRDLSSLEQTEVPAPNSLPEPSTSSGELAVESASQRLSDPNHPARFVFVPAHLAAVCGDCQGVFNAECGHCPGCGSGQWVLLNPARLVLDRGANGAAP